MAIPQTRLLSASTSAVTGKYPFAGGAQGALKLTDAVTGDLLLPPWTGREAVGQSRGRSMAVGGRRECDQGLVGDDQQQYARLHFRREEAIAQRAGGAVWVLLLAGVALLALHARRRSACRGSIRPPPIAS